MDIALDDTPLSSQSRNVNGQEPSAHKFRSGSAHRITVCGIARIASDLRLFVLVFGVVLFCESMQMTHYPIQNVLGSANRNAQAVLVCNSDTAVSVDVPNYECKTVPQVQVPWWNQCFRLSGSNAEMSFKIGNDLRRIVNLENNLWFNAAALPSFLQWPGVFNRLSETNYQLGVCLSHIEGKAFRFIADTPIGSNQASKVGIEHSGRVKELAIVGVLSPRQANHSRATQCFESKFPSTAANRFPCSTWKQDVNLPLGESAVGFGEQCIFARRVPVSLNAQLPHCTASWAREAQLNLCVTNQAFGSSVEMLAQILVRDFSELPANNSVVFRRVG